MEKNQLVSRIGIIVLCLGLFLWGLFTISLWAVVGSVLILVVAYIDYLRKNKHSAKGLDYELNIQGLTEKYGVPDELITANPTRSNEVGGCIMVYREKGFFIINGLVVKKSEITDLVLKNDGANPYIPADYQLHIETTLNDYPFLSVSVGNEISWAQEVLQQFQQELHA